MNSDTKKQSSLISAIKKRILLSDGAMGTMLQSYGYSGPTDILNLDTEALKTITGIHLSYLEAGSDIILTNTFGANKIKLSQIGNEGNIKKINENAIRAVKNAIDTYRENNKTSKAIFIAGDVGPTGKLLKPYGNIEFNNAVSSYAVQIESLVENGADFILIETIIDLNEALAAIRATKKVDPQITIACTLSFKENGVTVMGTRAEEFGSVILSEGCEIIGANCSVGSGSMVGITKKIRNSNPDALLLIQPNAGLPKIKDGKTIFNETPSIMARNFKEILKYKPSIIGGCCGSTPKHIKKLSELLDEI